MSFEKCPNCGFEEPSRLRKVSQHMNLYAHIQNIKNPDGKLVPGRVYGILNHHEDVVDIEPDVEGSVAFKVMKVNAKYTYTEPTPAKVALPNKPIKTDLEKQTLVTQ